MDECPRYGSPDRRSGRDPPPEPAPAERRTDGYRHGVNGPAGQQAGSTEGASIAESPSGPRWTVARTARGHRPTGRQPRPSRARRLDTSWLDVSPWLPWRSSWPRSRSPPRGERGHREDLSRSPHRHGTQRAARAGKPALRDPALLLQNGHPAAQRVGLGSVLHRRLRRAVAADPDLRPAWVGWFGAMPPRRRAKS
jgi:hypothetical protein